MGILDEDVARVRESTDLVALAGEHLALKRVGRRFMGLCPFHSEKTPSFSINPELGVWHCFGCSKSGDAITFVREVEHLDFVEAVERLAARAGITLRYDDRAYSKERARRQRLQEAVGAAIAFYHRLLLDAPEAGGARRYLRGRGFDGDAARRFQLGFAPDAFDALSRHLHEQGFARGDVVDAGLGFVNRAQRVQDQFRGRLMFPIYDGRGDPAGFGARLLEGGTGGAGASGPKYKNSPETSIYQKSRLLYGLNWAKGEIVARGSVVLCEGYTDVMAFVLAGVPNAVATCGTALADDHFGVLKNLARRVVLAYDADAAGQAAAERCYQWERRYEVEFRVADLPSGRDPADVWHDDPAALVAAIERAAPFLEFRLDRLLAAADVATVEGRARAGQAAAALVGEHPDELVRDQYVMKLAGQLGIEADVLRGAVARRSRRPAPRRGGRDGDDEPGDFDEPGDAFDAADADGHDGAPPGERERPVDRRELDALRWAIHAPHLVGDRLDAALFVDPTARAAFDALASAHTFRAGLDAAAPPVAALIERLAVEEPQGGEEAEVLVTRVVVNLIEASSHRLLGSMLKDGDERSSAVKQLLDVLVRERDAGNWDAAEQAGAQLVAWVSDRSGRGGGDERSG